MIRAGGEAVYLALAVGRGMDPYRLYNGLDESYRPIGDHEAEPSPPVYPGRVRSFVYAALEWLAERDAQMAGAKTQRRAVGG